MVSHPQLVTACLALAMMLSVSSDGSSTAVTSRFDEPGYVAMWQEGDLPDEDLPSGGLSDRDLADEDLPGGGLSDEDLPDEDLPGGGLSDADLPDEDLPGGDLSDRDLAE